MKEKRVTRTKWYLFNTESHIVELSTMLVTSHNICSIMSSISSTWGSVPADATPDFTVWFLQFEIGWDVADCPWLLSMLLPLLFIIIHHCSLFIIIHHSKSLFMPSFHYFDYCFVIIITIVWNHYVGRTPLTSMAIKSAFLLSNIGKVAEYAFSRLRCYGRKYFFVARGIIWIFLKLSSE